MTSLGRTMSTLTWEVDDENYRFPTIVVGMVTWKAHHSVSDTTDQVDGHFTNGRTLDMWFIDGPGVDDLRKDYADEIQRAREVWDKGQVLCIGLWPRNDSGIPSLLIPGDHFTGSLACIALERLNP